jgi:hypothetical protein
MMIMKDLQQGCVGHVQVCIELNDLGPFETARTRDQQLREQLETTRAKLEELWEEVKHKTQIRKEFEFC